MGGFLAFYALGRWGKGEDSSLKPKPKNSQSIGIHKSVYVPLARAISRNCCHDDCREENDWGRRKEKKLLRWRRKAGIERKVILGEETEERG